MNDADYEDVFVLSLPAINWFRASGSSAKRAWHYCELIGKRQMLVIGGAEPTATLGATPDPWNHGLGVFDMTELSWSNNYNASSQPYEQPSIVKQYYATNSPRPSVWNDPALAAIFATSTTAAGSSSSGSGEGSSSSSGTSISPSGSSAPSHKNVGAIAGGVVAGLVAICILLGLALLLLRRQHHKQRVNEKPPPPQPVSELDKNPAAQEMPTDRSVHQLGPADPWELDATRRSVA